jgi:Zinc-binding dehydrogenase
MNFLFEFIFGIMSRKVMRLAMKYDVTYSFLFVRPDGEQLGKISELLGNGQIKPVIDRIFPFDQAKEALDYLAQGRASWARGRDSFVPRQLRNRPDQSATKSRTFPPLSRTMGYRYQAYGNDQLTLFNLERFFQKRISQR